MGTQVRFCQLSVRNTSGCGPRQLQTRSPAPGFREEVKEKSRVGEGRAEPRASQGMLSTFFLRPKANLRRAHPAPGTHTGHRRPCRLQLEASFKSRRLACRVRFVPQCRPLYNEDENRARQRLG